MADNLAPITEQGASLKKLNDEAAKNTPKGETPNLPWTVDHCPYSAGPNRDAWMSGFGASKEDAAADHTSEEAIIAAAKDKVAPKAAALLAEQVAADTKAAVDEKALNATRTPDEKAAADKAAADAAAPAKQP